MIPLSIAFAGLDPAGLGIAATVTPDDRGGEVRALLGWVKRHGFRAVQLNAATPGLRPRDLDRSARRDLAATLRRHGLACSGLDLWIPPEHFTQAEHLDRAVASLLGAIDMAHDLATLADGSVVTRRPARPGVVSVVLPDPIPPDVASSVSERALARNVRLADHLWPAREQAPPIDVGLDPAAILCRGDDPAAAASRLGSRVASARLSDAPRGGVGGGVRVGEGGGRVAPGARSGTLDPLAYLVALDTAGYPGHAVLDLRGVAEQSVAVGIALQAIDADRGAGR